MQIASINQQRFFEFAFLPTKWWFTNTISICVAKMGIVWQWWVKISDGLKASTDLCFRFFEGTTVQFVIFLHNSHCFTHVHCFWQTKSRKWHSEDPAYPWWILGRNDLYNGMIEYQIDRLEGIGNLCRGAQISQWDPQTNQVYAPIPHTWINLYMDVETSMLSRYGSMTHNSLL